MNGNPPSTAGAEILLVEDDQSLAGILRLAIEREGYSTVHEADGAKALERAKEGEFDLVVLDVQLPGRSGLDICRILREQGSSLPILMISVRSEELDKVIGLDFGADDYLAKPFGPRELVARVRSLLRRTAQEREARIARKRERSSHVRSTSVLTVDMERRTVIAHGREVELSALEFDIVAALAAQPGRVLSRDELCEIIWGTNSAEDVTALSTYIYRTRQRLELDSSKPQIILTVRGVGYRIRSDEELRSQS